MSTVHFGNRPAAIHPTIPAGRPASAARTQAAHAVSFGRDQLHVSARKPKFGAAAQKPEYSRSFMQKAAIVGGLATAAIGVGISFLGVTALIGIPMALLGGAAAAWGFLSEPASKPYAIKLLTEVYDKNTLNQFKHKALGAIQEIAVMEPLRAIDETLSSSHNKRKEDVDLLITLRSKLEKLRDILRAEKYDHEAFLQAAQDLVRNGFNSMLKQIPEAKEYIGELDSHIQFMNVLNYCHQVQVLRNEAEAPILAKLDAVAAEIKASQEALSAEELKQLNEAINQCRDLVKKQDYGPVASQNSLEFGSFQKPYEVITSWTVRSHRLNDLDSNPLVRNSSFINAVFALRDAIHGVHEQEKAIINGKPAIRLIPEEAPEAPSRPGAN